MVDISQSNPWWQAGGLLQDHDLSLALRSRLQFDPQPFGITDLVAGRMYTLRGSRRVGKTVALKLLVRRLIEEHEVAPRSIGWWNADTSRRADILESQLETLLIEMRREVSGGAPAFPSILIVDEVTAVPHWQRALKRLKDHGALDSVCVILTGSSAHDLKVGSENMAGRRGVAQNLDRVLMPLSFAAFRRCVGDAACVRDYLIVGGYPFRVEEYLRVSESFDAAYGANVLEEIFMYEVVRRGLDRSIALEVLVRIASLGVSAISYDGFASAISTRKETARRYLDALGDAFLLATYSSLDLHTFRSAPKKGRKFLWFDPAFGCLAHALKRGPLMDTAAMAESIVGAELIRRYETFPYQGFSSLDAVYTWKGSAGHEVDFVAALDRIHGHSSLLPVEVKYQNSISEWDLKTLEKSFGRGVLVSKEESPGIAKGAVKVVGMDRFLSE